MIYRIVHKTTYKYKTPVSFGNHVAYLTPRPLPRHTRTSHELLITPPPARPLTEALLDLTGRIYKDFQFDSKATNVRTSPEEVLRNGRGVCQDFAHLEIACLRSLGLPARYVSGYLRTYAPPGRPRLVG